MGEHGSQGFTCFTVYSFKQYYGVFTQCYAITIINCRKLIHTTLDNLIHHNIFKLSNTPTFLSLPYYYDMLFLQLRIISQTLRVVKRINNKYEATIETL